MPKPPGTMPKTNKRSRETTGQEDITQQPSKKQRRDSSPGSSGSNNQTPVEGPSQSSTNTQKFRHHTLYDAVAGRLTNYGFLDVMQNQKPGYWIDTGFRSTQPITPMQALFRQTDAPDLYEENNQYNAHKLLVDSPDLKSDSSKEDAGGVGTLPSSDLLKALHAYASDFYAASTPDKGRCDWQTLDETALLAVGMIMEEEVSRLLGKDGWAVFVDPQSGEKNTFHELGLTRARPWHLRPSIPVKRTSTLKKTEAAQESNAEPS